MATDKEIGEILQEVGAWQTGHFLLSSGLHSNQYVQCQKVLQYPRYGKILADTMAKRMRMASMEPDAIVGPALGAVHWELLVAAAMDSYQEDPVRAIFAERPQGSDEFEIRRGIKLRPGEKVFVVEDVITTGGSVTKVIDLVRELGAVPIGVGTIIDRSGGSVKFDVPFIALMKLNLNTHEAIKCPLCTENVPLLKPGSSKK